MTRKKLTEDEIGARLATRPAWRREGDAIARDLRFASFPEAFAFMTRCAFEAEALDHHPDWSNAHARVAIRLTTHDAGGLTERDFALAARIDAAAPPA